MFMPTVIYLYFYRKRDVVKKVKNILIPYWVCRPKILRETHKIAVTLCELKKHKEANRLLKKLLIYKPYDIKILHYIAVSYFNMQMYNDALTYWDKIDKIVPHNSISSFYKRLARAIMKKEREFREIPYHFQVPYEGGNLPD